MQEILEERNIEWLYHFTQATNLESILRNGICPRDILINNRMPSRFNDQYRYDECTNAVCTSIEFPNYKMFYKLRCDNPDIEWVVLRINASVLYKFNCAFCWTNAGDSSMYNTPLENRIGIPAFLHLFDNVLGYPFREVSRIPDYYPTNPQAEVLVFNTIPVDYIEAIIFNNYSTYFKYRNIIPEGIPAKVNENLFGPRKDYELWR